MAGTPTTTVKDALQAMWRLFDHQQQLIPNNWNLVLMNVFTLLEDQNLTSLCDYEELKKDLLNVIKNWQVNCKNWQVTSWEQFLKESSRLLKNTLARCYDSETANIVNKYFEDYVNESSDTLEIYSYGPTKETTSTSSMIVPSPTDPADAESSKTNVFEELFDRICEGQDTSTNSILSTGSMFSYISRTVNGRALHKYGLEEDYADLRIQVKLYDGAKCALLPEKDFWKAKLKELDITVSEKSKIAMTVNSLFPRVAEILKKKRARVIDVEKERSEKRLAQGHHQHVNRESLSGYYRKWKPY